MQLLTHHICKQIPKKNNFNENNILDPKKLTGKQFKQSNSFSKSKTHKEVKTNILEKFTQA